MRIIINTSTPQRLALKQMRGFVGIKQTNTKNKIMETQVAFKSTQEIVKHSTIINNKLQELKFGVQLFSFVDYKPEIINPVGQDSYTLWVAKKLIEIDTNSLGVFAPAIKSMEAAVTVMFDGISYKIEIHYNYKHPSGSNGYKVSLVNNTGQWRDISF